VSPGAPTDPAAVAARRRAERDRRLAFARSYAARVPESAGLLGAVVVGSVARGDFHDESDTDLLLILSQAPARPAERIAVCGEPPAGVEPVVWTLGEWHRQRDRRDPVADEATRVGVWVVGAPATIASRLPR